MLRIRAWKSRRLTERSGLGEEGSLLLIEAGVLGVVKFLQIKAIASIGSKNCGLKHRPLKPSGVYPQGGSLGLVSPWSSSKIAGFEARELDRQGGDA